MLAVQNAVLGGDQDTTAPRSGHVSGARRVWTRPGVTARPPRVACSTSARSGWSTDLAVDTTDGLAIIRAALDVHGQTQATLAVGRLAAGDPPAGRDPNLFLAEAMQDAARLEAHLIAHAGHRAEARPIRGPGHRGVDRAGRVLHRRRQHQYQTHGGAPARLSAPVIGELLGPAADLATSCSPPTRPRRGARAEANAEAATDQLVYLWCREAYRQGVIVPDLPAGAVVAGQLVEWETFLELPPSVRQETLNHLEETTGSGGVNLDGNGVRDAIKAEQLASYRTLD